MKIYSFTRPELDYFELECNFTSDELKLLQSRYDAALQAQNMQAQMAQCLKRFFKAIRNLFTKKVNTVGTYA